MLWFTVQGHGDIITARGRHSGRSDPSVAGGIYRGCSVPLWQQSGRGSPKGDTVTSSPTPSHPFPLTRLQKVHNFPTQTPPAMDQVFKCVSLWEVGGAFHISAVTEGNLGCQTMSSYPSLSPLYFPSSSRSEQVPDKQLAPLLLLSHTGLLTSGTRGTSIILVLGTSPSLCVATRS